MIEAPALSTPTQRLLAARYAEIHRKFFPPPPVIAPPIEPPPAPIVETITPPPELPKREQRAIAFNETRARLKVIRRMVCKLYMIRIDEMVGKGRTKGIILPRHIYCYMAKRLTKASLPLIAQTLGGKDHTSILHAVRKIRHLVGIDAGLAERMRTLEHAIRSEFGETEYLQQMWPCDCRIGEAK